MAVNRRVRDSNGNVVRGVYYDKTKNLWRAAYSNKKEGIRCELYLKTKDDAVWWRREWERKYGLPRVGRPLKGKDTNRSNS